MPAGSTIAPCKIDMTNTGPISYSLSCHQSDYANLQTASIHTNEGWTCKLFVVGRHPRSSFLRRSVSLLAGNRRDEPKAVIYLQSDTSCDDWRAVMGIALQRCACPGPQSGLFNHEAKLSIERSFLLVDKYSAPNFLLLWRRDS